MLEVDRRDVIGVCHWRQVAWRSLNHVTDLAERPILCNRLRAPSPCSASRLADTVRSIFINSKKDEAWAKVDSMLISSIGSSSRLARIHGKQSSQRTLLSPIEQVWDLGRLGRPYRATIIPRSSLRENCWDLEDFGDLDLGENQTNFWTLLVVSL